MQEFQSLKMKTNPIFRAVFSVSDCGVQVILSLDFLFTASFHLFGASAYRSKVKTAQAEVQLQQKQFEYQQAVIQYPTITDAKRSGKK